MRKVKHRQEIFKIRNTVFSWNQIKTDRKMLFYIGLPSKSAFNTVFSVIEPSLPNMSYWCGTKRYSISSNTFTTWIRLLSIVIGQFLVNWLPREVVRYHLPNIYKKMGHHKLSCIIDCTEGFIERPKALDTHVETWSDYKSHNTFKF